MTDRTLTTARLGDLECVIANAPPPRAPSPRRIVVLLHGFGAPGDDLVGLADAFAAPDTTMVFPAAPLTFAELYGAPPFMDARAWWRLDLEAIERARRTGGLRDLTRERPEGLDAARGRVTRLLGELRAKHPDASFVLGGFSQGAMLATDTALREDVPLDGLVVLSGSLLCEPEWRPLFPTLARLKVFQSHGADDDILPYAYAARLHEGLREAGVDARFVRFEGGHGIAPEVLGALAAFLDGLPRAASPVDEIR
ncbi:MAG: phospholipase [Myxococcales bacterium]|jgi:phospholipase/carboxylesterase|nr:phospholipase [Myxococcales bacterium]MBL0196187.1 phospholipase [Myxococcales bacterium]